MPELGDFLGDLAVVPIAPDLVTSNQTQSLSSNKQAPTMEPSLRLSFFSGHIVPERRSSFDSNLVHRGQALDRMCLSLYEGKSTTKLKGVALLYMKFPSKKISLSSAKPA